MANPAQARARTAVGKLAIIRGVVSILFGLFALVWPGLTLVTFAVLLAIWLLVSGAVGLVSSILSRSETDNWVFKLIVGILQLGLGAYLVQRPGVTTATLVALVAIGLIAEGVIDLVTAFIGDRANPVLAVLSGFLGLVAGIAVWRYPVTGGLAFVWVLGLYALVAGSFMVVAGIEAND